MAYQPNLSLAWRRTKLDAQSDRVFVRTPYEIDLIDENVSEWVSLLNKRISEGYRPGSTTIADIPKGNGAIRPAALLSLEDRTVYADLVGALVPTIYSGLKWAQGTVDFAYQLAERHDRPNLFTNRYNGWANFRCVQMEKLANKEITHVVFTDLTGFYENIDLPTLMSDLRSLGCDGDILQLL